LAAIAMKDLLEAGVHFGHQTKRWNPKMKEFIFGERNGIYIIDLGKTVKLFRDAEEFITKLASRGETILFVGTKRQAQDVIAEEAQRCNMFFVNERWLGGLLTNFATIQRSLGRLRDIETMATDGRYDTLSKKEIARNEKERRKLAKNLEGIRGMSRLPEGDDLGSNVIKYSAASPYHDPLPDGDTGSNEYVARYPHFVSDRNRARYVRERQIVHIVRCRTEI